MKLQRVAKLLSHAETIPDVVSTAVRDCGPVLDSMATGIELHDATGRPAVCVDVGVPPEGATNYIKIGYRTDPLIARVRATHETIAMSDVLPPERYVAAITAEIGTTPQRVRPFGDHLAAPLVARGALIGLLRAITREPITPEFRSNISQLAHLVSGQLAHVGVPTATVRARVEALTMRQRQILRTFLHGHDEAAIAARLQLGERVAERELRAVFARLGAATRDALGAMIGRGDDWIDGYASFDLLTGVNVTRIEGGELVYRGPWPAVV